MKPTVFLLVFLFFTTACLRTKEKDPIFPTTVTGQVRTYGTQDPIRHPPVRVLIVERIASHAWGIPDSYKVVADTMSGDEHTFSLTALLDPSEEYYLTVEESTVKHKHHYIAPAYYEINHDKYRINPVGGAVNLNYHLRAYGWVEFHFVSEDYQSGDIYGYNFGGGASEIWYGPVDTYRIWDFAGNSEHHLAFNKKRDGEWINWQDDIVVAPFDTAFYEVKF